MPRKKWSPNNRSTEDESNSEESDSSLELNSRRNTYRKKPQRKCSLKHSQNFSHDSTEVRQRQKLQGSTLEKNVKRPSIIKIFRRIDRRAKNIYLVDDKIEDRNELVTSPVSKGESNISNREKSPHSFEPTSDKRSLFNRRARRKALRKCTEHPQRTVKTNYGERDLKKVNIRNQLGDSDAYPPSTDIATVKIDVWNRSRDTEALYPSKTDIERSPIRVNVCSQHLDNDSNNSNSSETDLYQRQCKTYVSVIPRDTDDLYSPVTEVDEISDKEDVQNQPCGTNNLYSPVTEIDEISDKEDVQNQPCDTNNLYSSVTDSIETPSSDDIWNQPCDKDLYFPVTDIFEKPVTDDIWNQPRDTEALYSSETDTDQTPMRDVCSQHLSRDFDALNSPEMDTAQTPNRSDDWSQPHLDSESVAPNSSYVSQTPSRSDVCSQYLNREFNAPELLVTEIEQLIEQISYKSHSFDLLNSDQVVSSDDELPNSEYGHFNFLSSLNLDVADVDHILNETADKTYRQPLSSDLVFSKTLLKFNDTRVNKADEVLVSRERNTRVFTQFDSHKSIPRKERQIFKFIKPNDAVSIIKTGVTNMKVKMKYILKKN